MIDFTVPDEIALTISGIEAFLKREVEPREREHRDLLDDPHRRYGPDGRLVPAVLALCREVRMASARAGYYTLTTPAEIGGGGGGPLTLFLAWEALYRAAGPARELAYQTIAHWATGPSPVLCDASPRIRQEVLPPLLSGEATCCFALSEPEAGSDVWAMKTRAVRDGDEYVLNGQKQWITNGPYADYAIVFAVTEPAQTAARKGGISCFVVPTRAPGFAVESVIRLYGHAGGHEAILGFTDVRVPADALIGEPDQGFRRALGGVSNGRLYNCARAVGLGRWALERATAYARERVAFGHPIAEYQGVQWLLAETAMELYAARMIGINCAWRLERGERAVKEVAMVKAFGTEAGFRAIDRCIQVFGGLGLTNEVRLYDALHQLRTVRIADGSQEIMRRTIAQQLLRGDLSF
jgi:acyl-CoA dehydrogenase